MKLTIPFYLHKVGAGFPSPATDYIEDDIDLNSHLITNAPATFIIRVQGKSMVNVGIYDGDLLIVDKSKDPRNFSTVIANINEELVVKTLIKEKERYLEHDNRVDDEAYRSFLSRLASPLKEKLSIGAKGLDFGCGGTYVGISYF